MVAITYKQKFGWPRYYRNYLIIGTFAIISIAAFITFLPFFLTSNSDDYLGKKILESLLFPAEHSLISKKITKTRHSCDYHSCFNIYKCGQGGNDQISVYVYPHVKYMDDNGIPITNPVSIEFYDIIKTIIESKFYTPNPSQACIFVPSLDMLNQNRLRLTQTSRALAALPFWNNGENHLLFNMLPGCTPDYNTTLDVDRGAAIIASAGFSSLSYRHGFDISIPMFNPLSINKSLEAKSHKAKRRWLLVSTQYNLLEEYVAPLKQLVENFDEDFLLLMNCLNSSVSKADYRCNLKNEAFEYPAILQEAEFCLIGRGARLAQPTLFDAIMAGCIPVVIADGYVLPFSEVLDWRRAILRFYEEELIDVMDLLKTVPGKRIVDMRSQLSFLWTAYFESIPKIVLTSLQIFNDRVFPHKSLMYSDWNDPPAQRDYLEKLSLPLIAPEHEGFTAVVLTYDRLQSLFTVIEQIAAVPSLSKILVIWNNQKKAPPPASHWPKIEKPLKVIRTPENKLSNRFYPYHEIETEAILSIDDDIVMMTSDEIEFAFQVWREFPDRIVGFPSRVHLWDTNAHKWKYESEWTNEISMVLTGIAFYHKFYNYMYTVKMPASIKDWVDDIMNCEDIAMNFLVSNITGKAPIKVAPRKKFKCPECSNTGVSADVSHMVERSECINRFAHEYGHMPLKTVEFRADPVLFMDDLPEKLKAFRDIGKL